MHVEMRGKNERGRDAKTGYARLIALPPNESYRTGEWINQAKVNPAWKVLHRFKLRRAAPLGSGAQEEPNEDGDPGMSRGEAGRYTGRKHKHEIGTCVAAKQIIRQTA